MTVLVGERYAQVIWSRRLSYSFFSGFAVPLLLVLSSGSLFGQSLKGVTEETCLRGDCMSGEGLELTAKFGKGRYTGGFFEGEFEGCGRLEMPISWTEKEVYVGN